MRTTWSRLVGIALLGAAAGIGSARPIEAAPTESASDETLLLQDPAVSATDVVFVYAQDLWIVPRAGGDARHPGGAGRARCRCQQL